MHTKRQTGRGAEDTRQYIHTDRQTGTVGTKE